LALTFPRNQFKVKSRFVVSVISGFVSTRLASAQDAGSDRKNKKSGPPTSHESRCVDGPARHLSPIGRTDRVNSEFCWFQLIVPSVIEHTTEMATCSINSRLIDQSTCPFLMQNEQLFKLSFAYFKDLTVQNRNSRILNGGSACTKRQKISSLLNGGKSKVNKR
jgi:hypothetical protein